MGSLFSRCQAIASLIPSGALARAKRTQRSTMGNKIW